jgi:hypothetical protein
VRRSFRAFATALAAFLLATAVPAAPAMAASGEITAPVDNATVGGQTVTIQVRATRDFLEGAIDSVKIRLSMNGTDPAAGTGIVDATCVTGCGSTDQVWTLNFDPMSFAPFGTPSVGRCNGGWWLQASIDGNPFGQGIRVVRSVAPSAPGNVTGTGGVEQATIRWAKAPEPDVVGYLVERRKGTGSWTTVASLGAAADRFSEDDVEAGSWNYRVVTLRGDGRTSGGAAAPCTDTGADLAAASNPVAVDVDPAPTSSDGGTTTTGGTTTGGTSGSSSTGGSGSTGDTTDGGTTDGGTTDGGTTDGGTTDGGTTDGGTTDGGATDGGTTGGDTTTDGSAPVRRVGPRQAAPPPVDSGPGLSGSLNIGSQDPVVAQERYFGEGDEFSETIDFGDAEAIVGEAPDAGTETRTIRVPGALQTILGEELDVMRLFGSVAAGLVLITFALHLRRWMRAGMVD